MKIAKLLHNPKAGDEGHGGDELVAHIEAAGYECRYSSTKSEDADLFDAAVDFIVVAGGDGTVRALTKKLLERNMLDKSYPIALLPMGTANNISKTLHITGENEDIIRSWRPEKIKKYDVGRVCNLEEATFFLESFGYGLFPYLMQEMEKDGADESDSPDEKLKKALEILHTITLTYLPKACRLLIDGEDHSGRYLLCEVMNIRSIGPNLFLSPEGDPGDGLFEVVLLPEADREKFAEYISGKLHGNEDNYSFQSVSATRVLISWDGTHVHADDEVVKIAANTEVEIEIKPGLLEFIVP